MSSAGCRKLSTRVGGRRAVTPLFIVFVTTGGTDILFALDSIPAVFGVTDQPYIVFAANAFAQLGLPAAQGCTAGVSISPPWQRHQGSIPAGLH